jgi:hemoglobin-like flavoprotein
VGGTASAVEIHRSEMREMSNQAECDLALFQASLQRATGDPAFYDLFYQRFIESSPNIARVFQNRDMVQLKKKLAITLEMVADTAEGKPGLMMYLEMLGKIHQRLEIKGAYFNGWRDALLETVAETDPDLDEATRQAWRQVIDDVTTRMLQG